MALEFIAATGIPPIFSYKDNETGEKITSRHPLDLNGDEATEDSTQADGADELAPSSINSPALRAARIVSLARNIEPL